MRAMSSSVPEPNRLGDLSQQARGEAAPKSMNTAIPLAATRAREPASDIAAMIATPSASASSGATRGRATSLPARRSARNAPSRSASRTGARRGGAEPRPSSSVRRGSGRHSSGCNKPALGVTADRAQRQEHRQDRAEEPDREHREAASVAPTTVSGSTPASDGPLKSSARLERLPGGEP